LSGEGYASFGVLSKKSATVRLGGQRILRGEVTPFKKQAPENGGNWVDVSGGRGWNARKPRGSEWGQGKDCNEERTRRPEPRTPALSLSHGEKYSKKRLGCCAKRQARQEILMGTYIVSHREFEDGDRIKSSSTVGWGESM